MIGGYAQNGLVNTDFDWPTTRPAGKSSCSGAPVATTTRPGCCRCRMSDERGVSFWQPQIGDPRLNTSRHIVFNLTRPEKSMILLAPLTEAAGGWGLCRYPKTKERVTVFANTADPDYQKLLAMCVAGKNKLDEMKRFDMPGFQPRIEWVREMRRYGVLAANVSPTDPIDYYATEKEYWQSLWYQPVQRTSHRPNEGVVE